MPCEHYKDALIEVAEAGAAPQGELRAHLDACASCRDAFGEEQSLFAAIDAGLHVTSNREVPTSLLPRVQAGLDQLSVTPMVRWLQPFVLAPAGVALAFLLLLVVRPHGPVPNNVTTQTSAPPTTMALTAGTHKDISPSNVQVASTTPNHLHTPRASTEMRSVASSNPEVLVPPDGGEAFARFVAALNERRNVGAALLAQTTEKKDRVISVDPLRIPDMEIEPLEGGDATTADSAAGKR
ncbi:MAG TPA: hypothetical protein VGR55_07880 [Candidatus Acidoferrum sp.]|nr:hypothetical protein [Candidatus Acidoferrum sp.]